MNKRIGRHLQKKSWSHMLKSWFSKRDGHTQTAGQEEPVLYRENPYLPQIREIVEQILAQKGVSYGEFAPIFIDGSDSRKTIEAATALSPDLNRLIILTEMPAYFTEFAEMMYEEQGLIVEIFPKVYTLTTVSTVQKSMGNVILDFEQPGEAGREYPIEDKIYIPIFKRQWESVERAQKIAIENRAQTHENSRNLDIAVPIGYNTVIVSIDEAEQTQPCLDKFERAFFTKAYNGKFS